MSTFQRGFQKNNRFVLQVFVPEGLLLDILLSLDNLGSNVNLAVPNVTQWLARGLLCSSARLPSLAMETLSQTMYGMTEVFPYHAENTSLDCTFLMPLTPRDNIVPRFFNYWQNYIRRGKNGPTDGFDFRFPNSYYGTLYLSLFNDKNERTITYQFDNAYPVTVQSTEVAWDADGHAQLPVSFAYSYWTIAPRPLIDINLPFSVFPPFI